MHIIVWLGATLRKRLVLMLGHDFASWAYWYNSSSPERYSMALEVQDCFCLACSAEFYLLLCPIKPSY